MRNDGGGGGGGGLWTGAGGGGGGGGGGGRGSVDGPQTVPVMRLVKCLYGSLCE